MQQRQPPRKIRPAPAPGVGGLSTRGDARWRVLTRNGSNTGSFSVAWLAPGRGFAILITTNAFDTTAPTGRTVEAAVTPRLAESASAS
jgi:hypothetical protein